MQFVQNLSRKCCLSDLKSPNKVFVNNPQSKNSQIKLHNKLNSKKSLKDFANLKLFRDKNSCKVFQSKMTRDKSVSTAKSIIDKIYEEQKKIKINSQKVLSRSPQNIINPEVNMNFGTNKKFSQLSRIKSLPKITFNIQQKSINPFEQFTNYQNKQTKYEVNLSSIKSSGLISFAQETPEQVKSTFLSFTKKKQEDQDLRSTMEPFLHIPQKKFCKGPKSIVSVNDQQEMSVNESIILQRHESSKPLMKLI